MILIIEVTKKPIIGRRGKTYVGICVCVWITALKFIHMNKQGNFWEGYWVLVGLTNEGMFIFCFMISKMQNICIMSLFIS